MINGIYESKKDNIWTAENLRTMKAVEDMIQDPKGDWKEYCFAESVDDSSCSAKESVFSVLSIFDEFSIETITDTQVNTVLERYATDDAEWKDV